jgi:hypothetical protein
MCAAASGHTECARLLLDAGADKDIKNNVRDISKYYVFNQI